MSDMAVTGARSHLTLGDTELTPHKLRMATGFDDLYHLTPARVLRNIHQLGYREVIRSEEHTSELQSLMRISYAVFCLKKKTTKIQTHNYKPTKQEKTKDS